MSTAFDKLARPVQKWIREQGWKELHDIQVRAIQAIYDSQADIIISATTAGGKTEAAFLPLISQILDDPRDAAGFEVLYIAPLKALITDQAQRLEEICRDTEIPVFPWHGDISATIKNRGRKKPKGLLLITPESLEAMFVNHGLEIIRLFRNTRAVVIDELHSILDSERGVQVRSLLSRLEVVTGQSIRRIGLSATLGDMDLVRFYLRPDLAENVTVIEASGGTSELQLQLRGYIQTSDSKNAEQVDERIITSISGHIFKHLRGSDNLVFANSRRSVEIYSDRLRITCEKNNLPQEFYPHHANLDRHHRSHVEERLKDANSPTTAICTSTLELGIDIGYINSIAQIGAPFSVAAMRQRLGRSGRREGKPAILRQYIIEQELNSTSNFVDKLRLGLVRTIAMIDLLLEKWCEPPQKDALHLSTLIHQVLSIIAERGGAKASLIYEILCRRGPFRTVAEPMFIEVLRAMGDSENALIEQSPDGILLLGERGEKLVEYYHFYAVFMTPQEYRLVSEGKEIGTLPMEQILSPGMTIIFSGRRWLVKNVDERDRVILLEPTKTGTPPRFGGDPGIIHDRVIERMFEIYEQADQRIYMDKPSLKLLDEARKNYARLCFTPGWISQLGDNAYMLATRCGTVKNTTLALALGSQGFSVHAYDGFIEVRGTSISSLVNALTAISNNEKIDLFEHEPNLVFEKFHRYLTDDLLQQDALHSRLDLEALSSICGRILGGAP